MKGELLKASEEYKKILKKNPDSINARISLADIFYILGLLNSDLISYYLYKFVYNNAIRSMDFYPAYAGSIPFFKASDLQ